jgi:hypothetical protein
MNFSIATTTRSYVVFLPNVFPESLAQPTVPQYSDDEDVFSIDVHDTHDYGSDEDDIEDLLTQPSWSNKFDTNTDDLDAVPAAAVLESSPNRNIDQIHLDEIPKQFYNLDQVPQTTNLACWGCGSQVLKRPWQLAIAVDRKDVEPGDQEHDFSTSKEIHLDISEFRRQQQMELTKKTRLVKTMKTHGIFCHVWCIGRYLKYPIDVGINKWQAIELTKETFKIREGKTLIDIPVGESPYIMSRYSGPGGISEEEYYKINLNNLKSYVR